MYGYLQVVFSSENYSTIPLYAIITCKTMIAIEVK